MVTERNKTIQRQYDKLSKIRNILLKDSELRISKQKDEPDMQLTDVADRATHNLEDELQMKVVSDEIRKLKQIEDALKRIDASKYGICVSCGCDINIERLNALPFATLCVKCKEREECEDVPEGKGYSYVQEIDLNYDLDIDMNVDEDDDGDDENDDDMEGMSIKKPERIKPS